MNDQAHNERFATLKARVNSNAVEPAKKSVEKVEQPDIKKTVWDTPTRVGAYGW